MFRYIFMLMFSIYIANSADLGVFPPAKADQKLHAINLQPLKNEKNYRIIVEFGQNSLLDCNNYFFTGGELYQKNLKGYGYVYYEFVGNGELAGTKMKCDNTKSKKFVKYGKNIDLLYNSTTPIIIYAPKNIEIRYKVFKLVDEKFIK